jgi:hypothetical protein
MSYRSSVLVKWITCRASDRAAFHHGQVAWARLQGTAGFLGQCGGWGRADGAAHVFACWADVPAYRAFMAHIHDELAAAGSGTYESIEVRLLERRLTIAAQPAADPLRGGVARLAHCHVRTSRRDHFVQAQAEVWNPGMAAAPGMLGGLFAERADAEFLVLTSWRSDADHDLYRRERFAALRDQAGAPDDLEQISGDLIDLEPEWTVTA